ncbi:Gp49 family protein [Herbaspirillum chlorophenolicum]|uniref:Gp49 family protein n=1 Tax=Herbaspirillum chlorophenolicum TaxID=211589 RepID=UPI00067D6811|nr:Gp49 family protein [Herbaspirillum chlorophenolicum]
MPDQAIENEIQAKGLTAPRITLADIDRLMARVEFKGGRIDGTTSTVVHAFLDGKFLLASGHSACVSPENFDAELGFNMAKASAAEKAADKLWELEGYVLFLNLNSKIASV